MNPYEPPLSLPEKIPQQQVRPLIGIPVVFGGFTLLIFTFIWIVDHLFRWQYELPFRWWI